MTSSPLNQGNMRRDTIARWIISTIGIGTIFSVLAIIVVIFLEILPLFTGNHLNLHSQFTEQKGIVAFNQGPWFEKGWTLNQKGQVHVYHLNKRGAPQNFELRPGTSATIDKTHNGLDGVLTLLWNDGLVQRIDLKLTTNFDGEGQRNIVMDESTVIKDEHDFQRLDITAALSRATGESFTLFAGLSKEGRVLGKIIDKKTNFLGQSIKNSSDLKLPIEEQISRIEASNSGRTLYTITHGGRLDFWSLLSQEPMNNGHLQLDIDSRKVTDITPLIGTDELAVAYDNGDIELICLTSQDGDHLQPTLIHRENLTQSPIEQVTSSPRNRTLFIRTQDNTLCIWFATHKSKLFEKQFKKKISSLSIAPRGHGLALAQDEKTLSFFKWDSPHPEASFQTYFKELWYMGYPEPDYVWQSSSGSDDFEPKLSLVPLIFGSIKGAFYAMLFSAPLAILAALYTSIFATPAVRNLIKPVVEMMSAIPSVVIGFLGALWLAPIIDSHLLTMAIFLGLTPMTLFLFPWLLDKSSHKDLLLMNPAFVLLASCTLIVCVLYASSFASNTLEFWGAFGGDFRKWLIEDVLDGNYDIRNSIIIGLTLGFAVTPIIYSLSEESISSVPKGLSSASLAMGATPWQTAYLVILPAASPGIFAAVTLGLGRAIGETMIVLMATGNTPITNLSIFEGFRALSANIAVEIPEAPAEGTLYRTLFLSAAVLLVFTSILNTITELIRHRLAATYAKL